MNKTAKIKVKIRLIKACFFALARRAWWDQVIVKPEVTKIKVFVKGTVKVLIGVMNFGGHIPLIL